MEQRLWRKGWLWALPLATMALCLLTVVDAVGADASAPAYVGSDQCKVCHATKYANVFNSGHPYKLRKVEGAAPTVPYPSGDSVTVPNPPYSLPWDSVTYMIGGFNWKARFLDQNGWIITGDAVQYNLATQGWVGYEATDPRGTKPYNCGTCHTTGWVPDTTLNHDDLSAHQDSLPGLWGTFSEPGVTCEACHGPGGDHVAGGYLNPTGQREIGLDETGAVCQSCHSRGDPSIIDVSGGFIRHHEQNEEVIRNSPAHQGCLVCHDPHKSTVRELGGVTEIGETCGSADAGCHADVKLNPTIAGHENLACYECHMSYTSKSAVATGAGVHAKGDLRGHLLRIAVTDKAAADTMFTPDGKAVAGNFVTLDFACLQCHDGNTASEQNLAWAAEKAASVHNTPAVQITSVKDVPNDQGGYVTITWNASPLDVDLTTMPKYSIWRALPQGVAKAAGRRYRVARVGQVEYTWEWLDDAPALKLPAYSYTAATLYDSMSTTDGMQYFMVVAHTDDPNTFGMSEPAAGYSVDNLAPLPPVLRPASFAAGKVALHWQPSPDADLQRYLVFRSETMGLYPADAQPIGSTTDTAFVDASPLAVPGYYIVRAQDIHENLSPLSNEVQITPTGISALDGLRPTVFALHQNAPNPFNPSTRIRFDVPENGHVRIVIYSQTGQKVRVLVDGEKAPGAYAVAWDGRDSFGRDVASGIYFARMVAGTFTQTQRMTLLR